MTQQTKGYFTKVKTMMRRLCCHDCIDNPFASLSSWQRRKGSNSSNSTANSAISDENIGGKTNKNDENSLLALTTTFNANAFELPEKKVNGYQDVHVTDTVNNALPDTVNKVDSPDTVVAVDTVPVPPVSTDPKTDPNADFGREEMTEDVLMEETNGPVPVLTVPGQPPEPPDVKLDLRPSPISPSVYLSREEILSQFADPDSDFELDDEWILMLQVLTTKNTIS